MYTDQALAEIRTLKEQIEQQVAEFNALKNEVKNDIKNEVKNDIKNEISDAKKELNATTLVSLAQTKAELTSSAVSSAKAEINANLDVMASYINTSRLADILSSRIDVSSVVKEKTDEIKDNINSKVTSYIEESKNLVKLDEKDARIELANLKDKYIEERYSIENANLVQMLKELATQKASEKIDPALEKALELVLLSDTGRALINNKLSVATYDYMQDNNAVKMAVLEKIENANLDFTKSMENCVMKTTKKVLMTKELQLARLISALNLRMLIYHNELKRIIFYENIFDDSGYHKIFKRI